MPDTKNVTDLKPAFGRKVGQTFYSVHFSYRNNTKDTIKDKMKVLIHRDVTVKGKHSY